ncbi:MAG TPA: tripartite tricarboxylate transporter substrate binding protein [Burkholderiales bacterium]|nr:tripartite tricarboxylate transporter substrate binding protein [Burkholderiales bacterium]
MSSRPRFGTRPLAAVAAIAFLTILAPFATAQEKYPTRPITLVVPFPPGGSDTVARILGPKLRETLGEPWVIDNKPGAAGTLGSHVVARAAADGYTLLFATASFPVAAVFYKNLPFDSVRDFAAVSAVGSQPFVLVVHPSLPAKSVKELIALAKSHPEQLNYASTGTGGIGHLASELFKHVTGVRITHVPYKGTGPAVTAVLAGECQLMLPNVSGALPYIRAGRLRALAVAATQRSALAAALPTFTELGYPDLVAGTWYGVLAPQRTPQAIVDKLNKAIVSALRDKTIHDQITAVGVEPVTSTPQEFAQFVQSEMTKWGRVMQQAGLSQKQTS